MTAHAEQLSQMQGLEREVRELRERECDLEVDCIAAQAALNAHPGPLSDVDPALATRICDALAKHSQLQGALEHAVGGAGAAHAGAGDAAARLRQGREALLDWLAAAQGTRTRPRAAHHVLLALGAATVYAALAVHLAFLLMLVPIGATSALLWSGQDARWKRAGARRRFGQSGLAPPDAWKETAVRRRADGLRKTMLGQSLVPAENDEAQAPGNQSREGLPERLAAARAELAQALRDAGIAEAALDDEMEAHIRHLCESHASRLALDRVKSEIARKVDEAERIRASLYRLLSREAKAPPGGHADAESLAEGLERLRDESATGRD